MMALGVMASLVGTPSALAQAVPVGEQFQVNTYTTSHQTGPEVATGPDGNFLVVWSSFGSSGSDTSESSIHAQLFTLALFVDGFESGTTTAWSRSSHSPTRGRLNQFILWAIAERVGALGARLDDPRFPRITYRRGVAGAPVPVLRRRGVRIRTLVTANQTWGMQAGEIAKEYGLTKGEVDESLRFYEEHRDEVDREIAAEEEADPVPQ